MNVSDCGESSAEHFVLLHYHKGRSLVHWFYKESSESIFTVDVAHSKTVTALKEATITKKSPEAP